MSHVLLAHIVQCSKSLAIWRGEAGSMRHVFGRRIGKRLALLALARGALKISEGNAAEQ